MYFYVVLYSVILCLCTVFLITAFWSNKRNNKVFQPLSAVCLILASLTFSLGLLEALGFIFDRLTQSRNQHPKGPDIILKYQSPPHVLVKDSILYLMSTNYTHRTFGHKFTTNGLGFRGKGFSLKKPNDTFRILIFGDSITFGVAIADEQRYSNLLEEMLNLYFQEFENHRKIEVLNFGMPGYAVDQEHDLMKAILKLVECDLIIVGIIPDDFKMTTKSLLQAFTFNSGKSAVNIDIYKNSERSFGNVPFREPKEFSYPSPWYEKTRLFKLIKTHTGFFSNRGLPSPARWDYVLKKYLGMKQLTKEYNLPPPIITLLYYGSVNPEKNDFNNPHGDLAQIIHTLGFAGKQLANEGFVIVDTLPLFKKYNRMSLAVSEWEWHPNYLAHYIYAQSIFDALLKLKLIK